MNRFFDAVVVGSGHAGCESALALARMGKSVLLTCTEIGTLAYMPCNPHIGGTGKGHLVREIDALGGEMGVNADKSLLQIKMLNTTKGPAVQSLRGQADKQAYHDCMLQTITNQKNITLEEGEVEAVLTEEGKVKGVVFSGENIDTLAVVVCSGVYMNARIIRGEEEYFEGPSKFKRSEKLSNQLASIGVEFRRFKTGTPARIYKDSIDYSQMEKEDGEDSVYSFSFLTNTKLFEQFPCYLTYTNEETHRIIRENITRAPMYNGAIKGTGPRYCPSIEDKVMRFYDKPRHQIFVEPESADSDLMYIQGMSSSMPRDVQEAMYRTIKGLEHCRFGKYAYAIEYDCIDPLQLKPSLECKKIGGLFFAGQVNGSSGYEEAAAQGLIAGINAVKYIDNLEPLILPRSLAYIGVLIDDLVTRGTNEPYRMMTARCEYRLTLRQDNADRRLTQIGRDVGLVDDYRYNTFIQKQEEWKRIASLLDNISVKPEIASPVVESAGENPLTSSIKASEFLKHNGVTYRDLMKLDELKDVDERILMEVAVEIKYQGYLKKEQSAIRETEKMENQIIPDDIDYQNITNLRLEARQKLNAVRPRTLGQATRISGVSPADINVLIIALLRKKG